MAGRRRQGAVAATPLLQLEAISKRFGAVQALADVDFECDAGEVVALVGDNGAGKSTLVKVIAGTQPADEGRIMFDGDDGAASPARRPPTRLGIATVYQDLALCDNLDVVANLYVGHERARGIGNNLRLLDEIGMEHEALGLLERPLGAASPACGPRWPRCRAASASRSPWPGPRWATPESSCSTSPPPPSAWPRPARCSTSSTRCARRAWA